MNLKTQIQKLHQEIDELPHNKELHAQLWDATEYLNEGMLEEADKIRMEGAQKLEYFLTNSKPINY